MGVAAKSVGAEGKIALISCPTLYKPMRDNVELNCEGRIWRFIFQNRAHVISILVHLYEFDERFTIYGADFVPYDYKFPLSIPDERKSYYDLVIADPPFLSDECLIKFAATIKLLAKEKVILCTGEWISIYIFWWENDNVTSSRIDIINATVCVSAQNFNALALLGSVMEDLAKRTLQLHRCELQPRHKNNLANEFCCFSNFDVDVLSWRFKSLFS